MATLLTSAVCLALTINIDAFAPTFKASPWTSTTGTGPTRRTPDKLLQLFATVSPSTTQDTSSIQNDDDTRSKRVLGSQELLMVPRQYSPGDAVFPSMNHVWCVKLSATPSVNALEQAIDYVMESHPLLRAYIQGDGEPEKRIDGLQMVREGEPNPMTFVSEEGKFSAKDVLRVVDVADKDALEASWKEVFARDIDDGYWCDVHKGPLWKVELHRVKSSPDAPCALVFTSNHAISDQGTANRMMDQLFHRIVDIESGKTPLSPPVKQPIPMAVEDSVLGLKHRWSDIKSAGVSLGTIRYVAGKALEGLRNPVLLPDNTVTSTNPLDSLAIMFARIPGGKDEEQRKTALQFRSLSKEATSALLSKCREQGVSMTDALTTAVTLTASDFVDNGDVKEGLVRNYKVLQSMDLRRFGAQLDKGETMACMAGSMDLMHGPLQDHSGETLRRKGGDHELFWNLAREGKKQTAAFLGSDGPVHAIRVFDFAMTISDMNNLVYLTSQSKITKGRAYSAGLTNVGVYERQKAFQTEENSEERGFLQIQHGRYKIQDVFFGSPHSQSGCLYMISSLTVNGEFKFTFHPASPLVSEKTNKEFADAFVELLEVVAGTKSAL